MLVQRCSSVEVLDWMPRSFASWKAVGLLEVAFAGKFVSSVADSLRVKVQVDEHELLYVQNMHIFFSQ